MRLCYLSFDVTVPAGSSVNVSASMLKDASYDHFCAGTENRGINGYDMVTRLGSILRFDSRSASISNYEYIPIVLQNSVFDL